jgi:hypothetical protein
MLILDGQLSLYHFCIDFFEQSTRQLPAKSYSLRYFSDYNTWKKPPVLKNMLSIPNLRGLETVAGMTGGTFLQLIT